MKNRILIYPLAAMAFVLVTAGSCRKDDDSEPTNPTNGHTTAVFNPKLKYGSMTDRDGNTYRTITIGTQTWMAENLRTKVYRNGDSIPNVTDNAQWAGLTEGAYCYYKNTKSIDSIATFGGLYNWYAVSDSRGLAPKGWRIPDADDWATLITYLGDGNLALGNSVAGDKMKEVGNTHWYSYPANNSSGFTALPGGWRNYDDGSFDVIRSYGNWWSATGVYYAYFFSLDCCASNVFWAINYPQYGYSARCIKD